MAAQRNPDHYPNSPYHWKQILKSTILVIRPLRKKRQLLKVCPRSIKCTIQHISISTFIWSTSKFSQLFKMEIGPYNSHVANSLSLLRMQCSSLGEGDWFIDGLLYWRMFISNGKRMHIWSMLRPLQDLSMVNKRKFRTNLKSTDIEHHNMHLRHETKLMSLQIFLPHHFQE